MKIKFDGAAGMVTGSQTRVTHNHFTFLVDCGLYQGPKKIRELNWQLPENISDVKAIIITHAHIDHSGLLPRWIAGGWKGPIYTTPATAKLLEVLLPDAARLQQEDSQFANKSGYSNHKPALPLYTELDAQATLKLIEVVDYEDWKDLSTHLSFRFMRAGHILGSSSVQIQTKNEKETKTLTFSGDLGGGHSQILREPVRGLESDFLILESTYGGRKIELANRETQLAETVHRIFKRGGTLIIPAFALGRTQDILLSLFQLKKSKKIPNVPIYLDSPMAREVTHIYNQFLDELQTLEMQNDVQESLSSEFYKPVYDPDQSMLLCMSDEPKIVISASGMLQGGRVLHHLKCKLSDPKSAVLFIGFQGAETKGRLLINGALDLRIHHQLISVEAEIVSIDGYSAHADSDELLSWVGSFKAPPKKIFLNHGEPESQMALAERLKLLGNSEIIIPQLHEEFNLE